VLNHWVLLTVLAGNLYRPPKLKPVDELAAASAASARQNRVAPSTREGISSQCHVLVKCARVVRWDSADPEPALKSAWFVPFFWRASTDQQFVPKSAQG